MIKTQSTTRGCRKLTFATTLLLAGCLLAVLGSASAAPAATRPAGGDETVEGLRSTDAARVDAAVGAVRSLLASRPREAVDKLNGGWMEALLKARRYAEVEEFANAGSIAMARDTWPVEQLQRFRVRALREGGKPKEALAAALGLFNVSGMGSTPHCIQLLCDCLREAYPEDRGIVSRFKLQQLALAATDEKTRREQSADTGERVLAKVRVDPKPFEKALASRPSSGYDNLYGTGNLLLLSGRTKEARELFQKIYETAPEKEVPYAAEGLAKAIKAEDGAIGRANEFVLAIRPKEGK